ncbi:unnamed protein product [Sphagnum tenellum]
MCMYKLATQWEKQLQDPAFVLMKTVQVRDDKWKCNIDEKNDIMNKLHNEMGPAVVKTVTDTHKEILEHTRSGMCVVNLA